MKIAVLKEAAGETRCAASPETVKKFAALVADVAVEAGAGEGASIADSDFAEAGASIDSRDEVLKGAQIILCINGPDPKSLAGAGMSEKYFAGASGASVICCGRRSATPSPSKGRTPVIIS